MYIRLGLAFLIIAPILQHGDQGYSHRTEK
jgi:hypothetical protein